MYNKGVQGWRLIAAVVGGCAAVVGMWLARPGVITATDVQQPRLSEPAPIPSPGTGLAQTFRAVHHGLSSVEVLAVYHGQPGDGGAALTLRLRDARGALVAEASPRAFEHNAPLRLSFAPQPASAGQIYQLEVSGTEAAKTSVWAYALDGYQPGQLSLGDKTLPGDLRFSTQYTYLWPDILLDAFRATRQLAELALPLWLVLLAPGLVLLDLLKPRQFNQSRWARWGGALALSVSALPLAWLWATTAGLGWSRTALGLVYAAAGTVAAGRWVLRLARPWLPGAAPRAPAVPAWSLGRAWWEADARHNLAMAGLLLASVLLRFVAVRDLALPAWVDSSHHAFVMRLLAESGRVPGTLAPMLALDSFTYHFGAHALLVTLGWFAALSAPDSMLLAGQALNGLMPLAAYAGAAGLTGRRRAGLGAAFFVGLVSFFPAYYATWGRYSQLVGLLLLPPAMAALWALLKRAESGAAPIEQPPKAGPWPLITCTGLLGAGLLLAHYRVFLFYALFVVVGVLLHARARRAWLWAAAAGAAGGLLAAPWVWHLMVNSVMPVVRQPGILAGAESYNVFPAGYFRSLLERGGFGLAGAAALWGLVRRDRAVWAIALWTGTVFGLLNLGATTWLVNNNAWAISLFVPVALLLGWGLDQCLRQTRRWLAAPPPNWPRRLQRARAGAGVALLAAVWGVVGYAGLAGARTQVAILNPVTLLSTAEDRQALDWAAVNTPADAVFLINGWKWLGESWAGADGGAWIMPYTGRRATLPPVTYAFGPPALHQAVEGLAARVAAIADADAPATLALLRTAGVTHVFIGARGGTLKPEMFTGSTHYRLLFTNGAAWVFAVTQP